MPKGTRPVMKHRTLWISDVHLGSRTCKARKLVDFLKQNDCEQLYLVGDIFDGWKLKTKFYWTSDHTRVIKAILAKARRGTKVYYLTGNHDEFMRQFVRRTLHLGRVKVAHEQTHTTADGRRMLVLHGDCFDNVTSNHPWLALAGMAGYEALIRSNEWINGVRGRFGLEGWTYSSEIKTRVKTFVQYLSGFDETVLHLCKKRDLHGVICGHTHQAEMRYLRDGVVSYNCGDWVESHTALGEDFNGNIRILEHEEQVVTRRPATAARRNGANRWLPRHRVVVPRPERRAPEPEPMPQHATRERPAGVELH